MNTADKYPGPWQLTSVSLATAKTHAYTLQRGRFFLGGQEVNLARLGGSILSISVSLGVHALPY